MVWIEWLEEQPRVRLLFTRLKFLLVALGLLPSAAPVVAQDPPVSAVPAELMATLGEQSATARGYIRLTAKRDANVSVLAGDLKEVQVKFCWEARWYQSR